MLKKYRRDVQRYFNSPTGYSNIKLLYYAMRHPTLRIMFFGRLSEKWGGVTSMLSKTLMKRNGIEITFTTQIGAGLLLSHPYGITVNPGAVLGENVTLFKGSTIGSVRSGKRRGTPVIGDNVVIGTNAFVCGGVRIGNDVLIAANSFVDFDVPDHSLVLGNPGVVKHKENATGDYI